MKYGGVGKMVEQERWQDRKDGRVGKMVGKMVGIERLQEQKDGMVGRWRVEKMMGLEYN